MSRRVLRIAFDKKHVTVRYSDGDDEFEVTSAQGPAPRLVEALKQLGPHVGAICEFPAKYATDIEARGASFTYTKDVMGATITAIKRVSTSNSPFVIHTPHTPESASETGEAKVCLSESAVAALIELKEAALDYVDGKRQQVEMFEEEPARPTDEVVGAIRGAVERGS